MKGLFFKDFKNAYIPQILEEIYINRVYEPYLQEKVDTIIDIGANIGLTSFYFSDKAKRVIAVEPSVTHLEVMRHMLKFNKINNVEVVDRAIYIENKDLDFYHNDNTTMFSLNATVNNKNDKETVKAITMEKLFSDYKIDKCNLMKLDVEGSEGEIIHHKSFETLAPKIDNMLIEYHQWCGYNPIGIINALRDYGFKVGFVKNVKATLLYATRK